MAEPRTGQVLAWAIAAALVLLLVGSFSMNGTWMGGMGMGWMMGGGILLLGLAIYFAYRFGRMEEKVDNLQRPKP